MDRPLPASKAEDPGVLQEPANDRADPDVLRESGDLRPECTPAANQQLDGRSGHRSPVEGIDHGRIGEAVHLQNHVTVGAQRRLVGNEADDVVPGRLRRDDQTRELGRLPRAGQQVEQLGHITSDGGIACQQSDVLIAERGRSVVVATPDVTVATQVLPFLANHE